VDTAKGLARALEVSVPELFAFSSKALLSSEGSGQEDLLRAEFVGVIRDFDPRRLGLLVDIAQLIAEFE
jgi:hypothetical protein